MPLGMNHGQVRRVNPQVDLSRRATVKKLVAVLSAALVATACGGGGQTPEAGGTTPPPSPQATSPSPQPTSPEATGQATVNVAGSTLGDILTDSDGRTLYYFLNDASEESTCYDACAENWPALVAEGEPQPGEGVEAALLGTSERQDGALQVTYNSRPLYMFAGDQSAGDTNGQGIGDVWFAASPQGVPIQD
jgi:predicted lipoprotein with Yx(FWY)xxD motif